MPVAAESAKSLYLSGIGRLADIWVGPGGGPGGGPDSIGRIADTTRDARRLIGTAPCRDILHGRGNPRASRKGDRRVQRIGLREARPEQAYHRERSPRRTDARPGARTEA